MNTVYRIVEINSEDGSYKTILGEEPEGETMRDAISNFAEKDVYVKDRARFIKFFYDRYKRLPRGVEKIFYRRRCGDEWRFACLETFVLRDPIVLMVVRDIEYDINIFFAQMKDD